MNKINLQKLIEAKGLNKEEVAHQLFPNNKFPILALSRVIKGVNALDTDQVSKLAALAGLTISEIFEYENWTSRSNDGEGIHKFTRGDYRAELNTFTWVTKLFHKESLFHTSVICSGSVSLQDYFTELDKIINNQTKSN